MQRPRITLARMMALVLYCGVAFGTLRYATELWASALFTLMFVLLLAATVCAALYKPPARAGWLGFAIFGWGFFLVGYVGPIGTQGGATPVITAFLFKTLHERAIPAPDQASQTFVTTYVVQNQAGAGTGGWNASQQIAPATNLLQLNMMAGTPAVQGSPSLENFQRVGAAHASFLSALFGGALARWVQRRRTRLAEKNNTATSEVPPAHEMVAPA
ncbi:MAG TPA: hypothetical protein VGY53_01070 [Isosphaeraceae bacterium]|nr:hypothetical protein [Isosphaeraceae bacterium]